MVEVLEQGYTGEYGDAFISIGEGLSLSDCNLVWDILDMFRVVRASVDKIGIANIAGVDERGVTFSGFDFNDSREARMAMYARHLVENDKWQVLAEHFDDEDEHGNSHAPMLEVYKRMLVAYRPIWSDLAKGSLRGRDGLILNAEEVIEIVRARAYPR